MATNRSCPELQLKHS